MAVYDGVAPVSTQVDALLKNLPTNPTTQKQPVTADAAALQRQYIASAASRMLAELSNHRYRMLVTNLAHSHIVAASQDAAVRTTGGYLLQRSFADMFNVKTLAGLLFRSPLTDQPGDARRAGPPFDLPASLDIQGRSPRQIWQLQLDLTQTSAKYCAALLKGAAAPPGGSERFLRTLTDLDRNDITRIKVIIKALPDDGTER
jgi:hypothetical protein